MDIWHLIHEFIWHLIFDFLLYGLLGLLLGIFLMVIAKKQKWLKRNFIGGKILVVLYAIGVPIIFAFTCAALAGIGDVKEEVHEDVHEALGPLRDAHFPDFQKYVDNNIIQLEEGQTAVDVVVDDFLIDHQSGVPEDEQMSGWKLKVTKWGLEFVVKQLLGDVDKKVGAEEGFAEAELDAIIRFDVDQANELIWEEVEHLILKQIDKIFSAFYLNVLFFWIITMLLPIGETIFAMVRRKKREKEALTADNQQAPDPV